MARNFYRRDPAAALAGMASMTLEERGVYNTVIDLMYLTWRPLENDRKYIAAHCNCAVQRVGPILDRLITRGKLIVFEEGGQSFITNDKFEEERTAVKGPKSTRSGRVDRGEVDGVSGGSTPGVEENPPTSENEKPKKQRVKALEKRREEKKDPLTPKGDAFEDAWLAFPDVGRRRGHKGNTRELWAKAIDKHGVAKIQAAIELYAETPDAKRLDGQYVPGMDRWFRGSKHENFIRVVAQKAAVVETDELWRKRLKNYRADGFWGDENLWGGRPMYDDCRCPPEILREFRYEPVAPRAVAV